MADSLAVRSDFLTLNVAWPDGKIVPAHGVYFCKIDVQDKTYPGIANVGIKPTVTEEKKLLIEAFLFGYSGNAYGEKVRISLMEFRRPEPKIQWNRSAERTD